MQINEITIKVGELAFEFASMDDWVRQGQLIWRNHDLDNNRGICIDAKGRIVEMGAHSAIFCPMLELRRRLR